MSYSNEIIDLTKSFTFTSVDIIDVIDLIEDTEDSITDNICISNVKKNKKLNFKKKRKSSTSEKDNEFPVATEHAVKSAEKKKEISLRWGDCPICWDELGKNSLVSTKCGHVYCRKCLEQSLKVEKKCPTCRHILKGSNAYHSLYIN